MTYIFKGNSSHTLGVEIELQIVDARTGALTNRVGEVLEAVPPEFVRNIKPEFMQSYVEICTDVCQTVSEARADLNEKLRWMHDLGQQMGFDVLWSGTHPFSRWDEQVISPGERYAWLMDTMQYVARRLVVFGLHVHVGVDSGDKAIQMCDRLLRHLPTMLALSANSPFWCGRETGMFSHRSKIMEALPTAGLPHPMRNWSEYCWLIDNLVSTGFIQSIREIWWDVRPHHDFGTVEMRIMDQPLNMEHLLGLVALAQCLVAGISSDIDKGAYLYDCHPMIAKQNKWHAARYGMEATFVDSDTMLAIPARQAAKRLLQQCMPWAERLGCQTELRYLEDIIQNGSGARRQRDVYKETGKMEGVVDFLRTQSKPAMEPTRSNHA